MKRLSFILLLIPSLLFAETPDWVMNNGKSGSLQESMYLTGFGMASYNNSQDLDEGLRQALEDAQVNLIKKVRVSLQNHTSFIKEDSQVQYREAFNSITQSSSNLEITGLASETYTDRAHKTAYALVYVSRSSLISSYRQKSTKISAEIKALYEAGRNYENLNNKTKAWEAYIACYPLFLKLEETEAVIAGAQTSYDKAFAELEQISEGNIETGQISEAVNRLAQKPLNDVEDLAWYLTYCLQGQAKASSISVMVTPFTYQDSKMGSQFSRYFKGILENELIQLAKWRIVQEQPDFAPQTRNVMREIATNSKADYVLTGSYWELTGIYKFKVNLVEVVVFQTVASVEANIPKDKLKNLALNFQPENFQQALSDQNAFKMNEVTDGGLMLEAWTNKGEENLLYTEGERMRVFIRVNQPCYIRFIYHLADGERALLLDNQYIDQSKVNMVYQIPQEFECSPPFGAEVLQVIGRTGERFPTLQMQNISGYDIILEKLDQVLDKTRGMKVVKQGVLTVESRLVITTMK